MESDRDSARDLAEVARSAAEAENTVLKPLDVAQVRRYISPLSSTPFALEYAFHLLGDLAGKTVLDLGCGTGENLIPLLKRGAVAIGVDISPELIRLAKKRLTDANLESTLKVGSAYATGLPDSSVDVIFCMSVLHHLDLDRARNEMLRILTPHGVVILKEPVRFSSTYARIRSWLPGHEDISNFEHPLSEAELAVITQGFRVEAKRYFRLPFVPLVQRLMPAMNDPAWKTDCQLLRRWPALERYATTVVMRLRK